MDRPLRPLLFLDVDGPLIPFGGTVGHGKYMLAHDGQESNPLATRLNPELGPLLLALDCELVWATTWMHDANHYLAPILGFPTLPVMKWPDSPDDQRIDQWFGLHWKTRPLVNRAAGRPFIWIDDEISDSDQEWVSAHHPGRALLHRVSSRNGLRQADFDTLTTWLETDTH